MDIPFNMKYQISSEDLREVPEDYNQMRQGVDFLNKKLAEEERPKGKARILSNIGVYSRILLDLDASEKSLQEALDIFKEEKAIPHAVGVKLRLAVTYQWMEKMGKADDIFHNLISKIESSKDEKLKHYLDFAYQHFGKSKFEQRQYKAAVDYFLKALDLRLAKGDMELIESSQMAIAEARKHITGEI